jgi:hypothetical protein
MVMEILQSLRGMYVVWFMKDEVTDPVKKMALVQLPAMLEHSL